MTAKDGVLTLTQKELDDLIQTRLDRGLKSWKAHARQWEDRCKQSQTELREALADRERWRDRAKFDIGQIRALEVVQKQLLDRLEGLD